MSDEEQKRKEDAQRCKTIAAAGIGFGIGSAALAAALLYSKQGRRKPNTGDAGPSRPSAEPTTPVQAGIPPTD